jgi:hypothetical protein
VIACEAEVLDVKPRRPVPALVARVVLLAAALFVVLAALVVASCAEPISPSLDLTPTSQTLIAGQSVQLTATRRFPGGALEDVTGRVITATSSQAPRPAPSWSRRSTR